MRTQIARLSGMQKFTIIWFGQMLSMFGTATTRFALLVWAYQQTGEATTVALLGFFSFILYVLLSPVAGVLIDRFDRRRIMIVADLGAALMTAMLLGLYLSGGLQIWHLYLAEALTGAFEAFQVPAYSAASTMLVSKEQYGRINGMRSLAQSASQVIAPVLAGLILRFIDLRGVMIVDLISFGFAFIPLLLIAIPHPKGQTDSENKAKSSGGFWSEMAMGFRYIMGRQGMVGLLWIYFGINLAAALTYYAVMAPMVLARTGNDELALGSVQSAMGIAGVIGGILMSTWGGPKRRIHGVLLFGGISFLIGDFAMAVGRTPAAWMFGAAFGTFFVPFIVGCERAIWQSKVEPALQGRVFAVQGMVRQLTLPIGYLVAGPLADRILEPAMMPGGALVPIFGQLIGTGPGAGMGLMFLGTSLLGGFVCFSGYLMPAVRRVETDLPDHDYQPEAVPLGAVPQGEGV